MPKYKVFASFTGFVTYDIEADSEDEARIITKGKVNELDCDVWEFTVDEIEEENSN